MTIRDALEKISQQQNLNEEEMRSIMQEIMSGKLTAAQIGAFLLALRTKGETVTEISAATKVLREFAAPVKVSGEHLVDIVGTGGDGCHTFNISTVSAFVIAAAGGKVAKHGNRSISSKSGSADVLEAAGAKLQLTPLEVTQCINEIGLGFMFAPNHHPAMRHVINIRKELGVRTLFNLLGPLTNPAHVPNQVIGVYSKHWLLPFAEVAKQLGSQHVLIVHADDGLDEISIAAPTHIVELKDGQIREYTIQPEDFGLLRQDYRQLCVTSAKESLTILHQVLANSPGAARDIVALNAGAAIYAAGLAKNLQQGVNIAFAVIASGQAKEKFNAFISFTQR
jgi:anthranilate phosphoribosyltransferase